MYEQSLKRTYLVHDFKEFCVDRDLNQTRKKNCKIGKYSWVYEVDLNDVIDLLMSKRNFPVKV